VTSKSWRSEGAEGAEDDGARALQWKAGVVVGGLVYLQSVVGALVRHKDAGVACPDVPLCLGRLVPPLDHPLVQLHFAHRALGVAVGIVALFLALQVLRQSRSKAPRMLAFGIAVLVAAQVLLGFVSVATQLHPAAVSFHTLLAASLLSAATALAAYGRRPTG
ncbi:MAG: COX15/CtaA family protein, partial [Longimicrobiales bacterium]